MSAVSADWQTKAAREREANRAQARAILARMEAEEEARRANPDPRPAAPSALFPYDTPDDNREFGREYVPKRTHSAADLEDLYEEVGDCWIGTGRYQGRTHDHGAGESPDDHLYPVPPPGDCDFCGRRSHMTLARELKERSLGRVLAIEEHVVGTCPTNTSGDRYHRCVNPDHHEIDDQGGDQ